MSLEMRSISGDVCQQTINKYPQETLKLLRNTHTVKFDSWLCWPLLCTWILQTFKHCLQFNLTSTFLQLLFVLSSRYHEQHREQAATTTVWHGFSWRWDTLSSLSFTPAQPGLHLHKLLSSFYIERVHSINNINMSE